LLFAAALAPLAVVACELIVPDVLPPSASGAGGATGDGGSDGPPDAPPDVAPDTFVDAPTDAPADAPTDAAVDAPSCFPVDLDAGNPDVPLTPIPSGYGFYCSVLNTKTRIAAFISDPTPIANIPDGGFPCEVLATDYPIATVQRAGLHPLTGPGVAYVHCDKLAGAAFSGDGAAAANAAYTAMKNAGFNGCIITQAPSSLPVFSRPYKGSADPVPLAAFNFDLFNAPLSVSAFGQPPSPPASVACAVDRLGRERCHFGSATECGAAGPGCLVMDPGTTFGVEYLWGMATGTPVLAVADGIVVGSVDRAIPNCAVPQKEIYIEHAVGSAVPGAAPYVERFVTGYLALSQREVATGDMVKRGQEIGQSGQSGCQAVPSLGFVVLRLTNLTGALEVPFQTESAGNYGFDGVQGAIDPFGWGAPDGSDPWGSTPGMVGPPGTEICLYPNAGAFSIDLWQPGEAPPAVQ
jgi:hypothetical protein